ncbi:MAG: hypothetical protein ACK4XH_23510 [Microcystis sp.]|jgi:hypothetical protein|uniref:hypothetical protein n=1 Tax=Microcystis sp. TaxID=1127 RepID=UPI00391D4A83
MNKVIIDPFLIRQFGDTEDCIFCLVTNPELEDCFEIKRSGKYRDYFKIIYTETDNFENILDTQIPNKSHVLVISPNVFFRSPPPSKIGLGRKLVAMACNSTPTNLETISHFLSIIEQTEPVEQQKMANTFFELARHTSYLQFVDSTHHTYAEFKHRSDNYLWNEQAGMLAWGEQTIVPSGEISVLPLAIQYFDERLRLVINGSLAIQGYPILHNGTSSFLRSDQERIYNALKAIQKATLIVNVEDGIITRLNSSSPEAEPACAILSAMFEIDSRYRTIWEVGFAINTKHSLYPNNCAMNEVHGGTGGMIHFGLGLTPYTQYHLDIICPNTQVLGSNGECIIGEKSLLTA